MKDGRGHDDDIYAGESEAGVSSAAPARPDSDPTGQLYPELQRAYAFFNERLFEGTLPPVLITLQRRHHTEGYWAPHRFSNRNGACAGELALNPCYFAVRSLEVILSTLVHAQAHVWQTYHGKPGRRGYHNREWADKMLSLGLHPSSTERPGGAETGESVGHYIVAHGPFDRAVAQLIAQDDFALTWYDRFPAPSLAEQGQAHGDLAGAAGSAGEPETEAKTRTDSSTGKPAAFSLDAAPPAPASLANLLANTASKAGQRLQASQSPPTQLYPALGLQMQAGGADRASRSRDKFRCAGCGASAWGKPSLQLKCVPCDQALVKCAPAT